MRRGVTWLAVAVLLAAAVLCQARLEGIERADPLGREVLYLPARAMLRLASLGNRGLAADLLYLWSIQYYTDFEAHEKFLYLETVYDLITDLDPYYFDAYRIGAMLMTIEQASDPAERRAAVRELYDKGLANMPANWELAEVAAWDAYNHLGDRELAVRYAGIGAARPGAPPRLARVYGRWQEKLGAWTVEESIAYWQDVLAEAERTPDVVLAKTHLYDAYAILHARRLDPLLGRYRARFGRCPSSWQQLIDLGWLAAVPLDAVDEPYGIDAATCALHPNKRIRWDE